MNAKIAPMRDDDRRAAEPSSRQGSTMSPRAVRVSLVFVNEIMVGLILAYYWARSGLVHLANPYYFLSSIYSYDLLDARMGTIAALTFPPMQLMLAACLATRKFVGGAFAVSVALLILFAGSQATAYIRGLEIGCGCFGAVERQPIGIRSLAFASFLLFCALNGLGCRIARLGRTSDVPAVEQIPAST